jgi:HSP20 family protein
MAPARDMFEWFFRDPWSRLFDGDRLGSQGMPIDMRETDDSFVIEAEMPGIRPEDTEVTVDGRTLTIRGRYQEMREQGGKGERYLVRERRSGETARSITLPASVDVDNVKSSFQQGELTITLPKAADSRARRIPIGT